MLRFALLLSFFLSRLVCAEDTRLAELRATLLKSKQAPGESGRGRGAGPALTIAKHQLRDWVEARLKSLRDRGDEADFARSLNGELRVAGLFCGEDGAVECPEWTLLGVLNPLAIRRLRSSFLVLQTGVGIECGFDESAYLYSWSAEGWRRVWQTEQNNYGEKYRPQTIHEVLVSPYNPTNSYLVLTLGSESWCMSNLHNVYYRAFRLGPDPEAKPLVEGEVWSRLDGWDLPIHGRVKSDEVLIEAWAVNGPDGYGHQIIEHYGVGQEGVRRTDPYALSPREFVWEWLTTDPRVAFAASEQEHWPKMAEWRRKLKTLGGEPVFPTMHCPTTPDVWQVAFDLRESAPPVATQYFLVRWRPPYTFRMVDVSDRPWPGCAEEDRTADEARTLFAR